MVGEAFTSTFKKKKLVYFLNALLVILSVFLSYRILSPSYERKESHSINSLGSLHTQLAAEKVGVKLATLREELKENGLRLVDPTRGPITLDSTKWLWMRIQDRDWRADKYLEPLPAPHVDVDTWAVRANKNSFILSERVPIMKNGVQDFVLLEGGLRPTVFQDLQTDSAFGVWVFDLKAYEKGGIGAAKIYEKGSEVGLLAKEEVKLLTSDLLMQLFQKQETVSLESKYPWVITFKNTSAPIQLGVLGYWLPDAEPAKLTTVWISLGLALLILSALVSYYIIFTYRQHEKQVGVEAAERVMPELNKAQGEEVAQKLEIEQKSSQLNSKIFGGLFDWVYSFASETKGPLDDLRDRVYASLDIANRDASPQMSEVKNVLLNCAPNFERIYSILGRFDSYFGISEGKVEIFDPEIFFLELTRDDPSIPKVNTYFDPDLWRVRASKDELSYLLSAYIKYLNKFSGPESKLHVSARYVGSEIEDSGATEVMRADNFKVPFVRFYLHLPTQNPIGRTQIRDLFDFSKVKDAAEMDLALSQRVVERMGARLKVKSNFEDGNVIILDILAHEQRRPEDKVNAKQLAEAKTERYFKTSNYVIPAKLLEPDVELKVSPEPEEVIAAPMEAPVIQTDNSTRIEERFEEEVDSASAEALRLSDIEKANSFAEGITDERSRVRSRFRIRKPGEK